MAQSLASKPFQNEGILATFTNIEDFRITTEAGSLILQTCHQGRARGSTLISEPYCAGTVANLSWYSTEVRKALTIP